VIDFGESFPVSSPPDDLGIPEEYLAPEVLLSCESSIGPACDLWALGCTLFEIRRQIALFYMINDRDELIAEMIGAFGKLPEQLWEKWEARADFFDEKGKRIGFGGDDEFFTLDLALNHKIEVLEMGGKQKKVLDMEEEEQRLLKDLLLKLFVYEPRKRLSAEEVLGHDWFKI
jgi:serine/threonine-protein kinase SRPK3